MKMMAKFMKMWSEHNKPIQLQLPLWWPQKSQTANFTVLRKQKNKLQATTTTTKIKKRVSFGNGKFGAWLKGVLRVTFAFTSLASGGKDWECGKVEEKEAFLVLFIKRLSCTWQFFRRFPSTDFVILLLPASRCRLLLLGILSDMAIAVWLSLSSVSVSTGGTITSCLQLSLCMSQINIQADWCE